MQRDLHKMCRASGAEELVKARENLQKWVVCYHTVRGSVSKTPRDNEQIPAKKGEPKSRDFQGTASKELA